MTATFVVSDTHFGHKLMVNGTHEDGTKLRPWNTTEEHDEALVARWNAVVKPKDRVYHLGDVAIYRRAVTTIARCHGRKILIKGNHDIFKLKDYLPHFDDIRAYRVFTETPVRLVLSHIPLHTSSLQRFGCNIHGHLHHLAVRDRDGNLDARYRNVCVEHTNYAPLSLDAILASL